MSTVSVYALAKLVFLQAWVCVLACAACKCANVQFAKIELKKCAMEKIKNTKKIIIDLFIIFAIFPERQIINMYIVFRESSRLFDSCYIANLMN